MSTPGSLTGLTAGQIRARARELRAWPTGADLAVAKRQLAAGVGPDRDSDESNAGLVELGLSMCAQYDEYRLLLTAMALPDPLVRLGGRVRGEAERVLYAEMVAKVRGRWDGEAP